MTGQRDDAAERSAHVRRVAGDAGGQAPFVQLADGTWKLRVLVEKDVQIAALTAENAALRAALLRWQHYGCPDCGGDCGSANPPVSCCIMQETRAALKGNTP